MKRSKLQRAVLYWRRTQPSKCDPFRKWPRRTLNMSEYINNFDSLACSEVLIISDRLAISECQAFNVWLNGDDGPGICYCSAESSCLGINSWLDISFWLDINSGLAINNWWCGNDWLGITNWAYVTNW